MYKSAESGRRELQLQPPLLASLIYHCLPMLQHGKPALLDPPLAQHPTQPGRGLVHRLIGEAKGTEMDRDGLPRLDVFVDGDGLGGVDVDCA